MPTAEERLLELGFDGQRLRALTYAIAHRYCQKTNTNLDVRIDDLAQHLALTACRRTLAYRPELNRRSTFASYLYDILEPACIDFFRRKGEGFQDRRYYGVEPRVELAGDLQALDEGDGYLEVDVTLEEAAAQLAAERGLSSSAVWALEEVATRIERGFTEGQSIRMAAKGSGIRPMDARARLDLLRSELAA